MKTCSKCGSEFEDRFKFCPECGAATGTSTVEVSMGEMRTMVGGREPGDGDRKADGLGDVSLGDARTMAPQKAEEAASGGVGDTGESIESRYEILEEIGRGGFAQVWKARDRKLGRIVALKRLTPEGLSGPEGARTLERFRREAQAIASLNHRNIVGVYDRGEDAQGPYIVMEYVDGGSLRDLLKAQGKLEISEAVRIANAVAKGLDHAHRKNLVHRDIKPANILLQKEGTERVPKIADFGLARAGTDTGVSMSGYGMGTPAYMPPEQRRDAKNVNHTADLYALGKTLYEMVTGLPPDDVDADKLPPVLAGIVKRCIKPNPEERYFSAADLSADLERVGPEDSGGSEKRAVGGAKANNVCPACGKSNTAGTKYCAGCGTGLVRKCPECGGDVAIHDPFCGVCGTDVSGFERFRDGVAKMERFAAERQWGRVLKEHGLLPAEVRMTGAKGRDLCAKARTLSVQAERIAGQLEAFRQTADAAIKDGRWVDARNAVRSYTELGPKNTEMVTRLEDLQRRAEDEAWEGKQTELRRDEEEGRLKEAVGTLRIYLRDHPQTTHFQDGQNELARLEKLVALDVQRVCMVRANDFTCAEERLSEMVAAGLSEGAAAVFRADIQKARDSEVLRNRLCRRRAVQRLAFGVAALLMVAVLIVLFGKWQDRRAARLLSEAEAARNRSDWPNVLALTQQIRAFRPKCPQVQGLYKEACRALAPREGATWMSPATGMVFVWVPVAKLWVGKYEVTNDEYRKMKWWHRSGRMKKARLDFGRQPVVRVSFSEAKAFAGWQTAADTDRLCGCGYRLPSESEWQTFASCGGVLAYPWGVAMPPQFGNYADVAAMRTFGFAGLSGYNDQAPATCFVEQSGENACGLFGVGGNVWECCAADTRGATFGAWRGASWANFSANELRCAYRCTTDGATRKAAFGFRLVLTKPRN